MFQCNKSLYFGHIQPQAIKSGARVCVNALHASSWYSLNNVGLYVTGSGFLMKKCFQIYEQVVYFFFNQWWSILMFMTCTIIAVRYIKLETGHF